MWLFFFLLFFLSAFFLAQFGVRKCPPSKCFSLVWRFGVILPQPPPKMSPPVGKPQPNKRNRITSTPFKIDKKCQLNINIKSGSRFQNLLSEITWSGAPFHYIMSINLETVQRISATKATCTDNYTFQVEHSNSTSSSEACNTTIFIFAVLLCQCP